MLAVTGAPDGTGAVPGRRVVVTGLGVVSSCGIGVEPFWQGLLGPAPVGGRGPLKGLDVSALFGPKEVRRADRFVQLAAAAADEAVNSAGGIEALRGDPDRTGTVIGTGVGGLDTICEQHQVLLEKGPGRVSPFLVPMIMCNRASADISMRYGLRGPCEATVTACAAGAQSIANAGRLIATGRCDVMLAGGTEAPLSDLGIAGFANMTALSSSGVSMPFDVDRDGFVIGEGAGVIVLEERSRAIARGAHLYAELAGAASTADAHHITAPSPDGSGAARCMELALADALLSPADVTHVNTHGTSTPPGDAAEAEAIYKVFGAPGPASHVSKRGSRAHAGRRRRHRSRGCCPQHAARPDPADDGYAQRRPGVPARRGARTAHATGNRDRCSPTPSASAATTAAWCWCGRPA